MTVWGSQKYSLSPWQDYKAAMALFGIEVTRKPQGIIEIEDLNFLNSLLAGLGEYTLFEDQPPFSQRWIGTFYQE